MSDSERRLFEEIQRLRGEILNCAHCASMREQIVRLSALIPPAFITEKNCGALYAMRDATTGHFWKEPEIKPQACAICGELRQPENNSICRGARK